MTIAGNFKTKFLKNENLFQKSGIPLLVEGSRIENATFLYKAALSEANVKTDRMGSIKWTYHKDRSFASNYFIFFENFVSV